MLRENVVTLDLLITSFAIIIRVRLRVDLHLTNLSILHLIKVFKFIILLKQVITSHHPTVLHVLLVFITIIVTIITIITTTASITTTTSAFTAIFTTTKVTHFS